ncbi:MAG: glycosyltransferase family 4 protein [Chloroflexi bacterium]|nr:glycosyltransferase family 4 protein [Chloroflexota bacterium]
MRVLLWTEGFWPHIGGVSVISGEYIVALQERGYDCTIVTSLHDPSLPPHDTYHGIPVRRFPFSQVLVKRDLARMKAIERRIAQLSREFRPDVIHFNECGPSVLFGLMTQSVHPAPVVVNVQSILPQTPGVPGLLVKVLRRANWVAAVSQAMLEDVRRFVPEIVPRSSLVYDAAAPPAAIPVPLTDDAFGRPRLLCVGRIVRDKGFDVAVAALPAIRARFPETRLVIAGDGSARDSLEKQAGELGVSDAVEFIGWVEHDRVPALMSAATLVVVPSRWREPFGLVALEAGQVARPVVATRVGGLAEVVADGENGLLIDNEDAIALAAAVTRLLEDPDLARRMGEAGRRRARELFSMERFVDDYEEIYRKVVRCTSD